MTYLYKNRGFWEVIEPVVIELVGNRNEYSYICAAFKRLHSQRNLPRKVRTKFA